MIENDSLSRIMAIDYGTRRIGLALTDPLFTFAYPFKTLPNDSSFFNELRKIINEQNILKIILGYPLKESGESSSITEEVLKFKKKLENAFKLEVVLKDERYTSSIAKEIINKTVTKKSKRRDKGLIDKSSAAIILQDYLDENGN
jgi:putative Holliday junction resolvase